MKKYLFVVPSLSKGGAERVVSILANQLVRNKKVTIVTHYKTENDYYVNNNVNIICLSNLYEKDYRKKINIIYLIKLLLKLRKTIINEKPNYIIPFLWTTCIRVDLALLFNKYKENVIQTVRNDPNSFPKMFFLKKYRNYLIHKSSKTIVQNMEQKEYFKGKVKEKIYIMPNPVSNAFFSIKKNNKENIKTIIGVGRLEKQKNFPMLINAFLKVHNEYPNTKLIIYGEGKEKNNLEDLINKNCIENSVLLYGRTNDYDKIYGEADIFVLSSNFEGMPNTLLEAMASGLPCISTDCPTGPKSIIVPEENGILIQMNSVEELYNAIVRIITDKAYAKRIANKAIMTVKEKYSEEKITQLFVNICESKK